MADTRTKSQQSEADSNTSIMTNARPSYDPQSSYYDPHIERSPENKKNSLVTLIYMLRESMGPGILAMPQAMNHAGLATGVISTILIGIWLTYCLHQTIRCQYEICKIKQVTVMSYPKLMKASLEQGPKCVQRNAPAAPYIANFLYITFRVGLCSIYILFITSCIKSMFDPVFPNVKNQTYMSFILLSFIFLNFIRDLKLLQPLSIISSCLFAIGLCVTLYYLIDLPASETEIKHWNSFYKYPWHFGTVLFTLTAIKTVIDYEQAMKTPEHIRHPFGLLTVVMGITIVIYVTFGILGYLYCRQECKDSVIVNFPFEIYQIFLNGLFAVSTYLCYISNFYVPVELVWVWILPKLSGPPRNFSDRELWATEIGLRLGFCLLSFLISITFPYLGVLITFFGAFCVPALTIIFPGLMELCLIWNNPPSRMKKFNLAKNYLFIIFGIIGQITGTCFSVYEFYFNLNVN